ncbi:MAG: hypothetical protein ACRYGR_03975 [Janthinobacterium lividum]
MQIKYPWIKNYIFIVLIFLSLNINAQENTENMALKHLDILVVEIKQALTSDTLVAVERDQIYDIIGSLGICRPVVQTVLEQSASHVLLTSEATPNPAHPIIENQDASNESLAINAPHQTIPSAQHISSMDMILNKFDTLKLHLIQQLADNKIEATHLESAYTLIGSINLCRPILKGADLLSEKMKAETSKDQPVSIPAPEHPIPAPNPPAPSLETPTPIAS